MNHLNLINTLLMAFSINEASSVLRPLIMSLKLIMRKIGSSFKFTIPLVYDYYVSGNLLLLAIAYSAPSKVKYALQVEKLIKLISEQVSRTSHDVIHDVSYSDSVKIIDLINFIISNYLKSINLTMSDPLQLLFRHIQQSRSYYAFGSSDELNQFNNNNSNELNLSSSSPVIQTLKQQSLRLQVAFKKHTNNSDTIKAVIPLIKYDIRGTIDDNGSLHIVTNS